MMNLCGYDQLDSKPKVWIMFKIVRADNNCDDYFHCHYDDIIMHAMVSQITSLTIVYSSVYSGRSKKTSNLHITGLCEGNSPVTCEFPAQRASNVENVSIWWRHHGCGIIRVEAEPDQEMWYVLNSFTETKMLFWWNFHHWLHWKLSF